MATYSSGAAGTRGRKGTADACGECVFEELLMRIAKPIAGMVSCIGPGSSVDPHEFYSPDKTRCRICPRCSGRVSKAYNGPGKITNSGRVNRKYGGGI